MYTAHAGTAGARWKVSRCLFDPFIGVSKAFFGASAVDVATEAIDAAAARAEAVATDAGVDAMPIGQVGEPVAAIVHAAAEHHADVIVVGSQSRGWLSRLFEPSVSVRVQRATHLPVLVVDSGPQNS